MVKIEKSLSSRIVEGMSQIYVRVTLSRKNRPRLKTGIYVKKRFFYRNDIRIPASRRIPAEEKLAAMASQEHLNDFCNRIQDYVSKSVNPESITKVQLQHLIGFKKVKDLEDNDGFSMGSSQKKVREKYVEKTIYDYFDEYVAIRSLSTKQREKYMNLKKHLLRFEFFMQMMGESDFKMCLSAMDVHVLSDFRHFCANEGELSKSHPALFAAISKRVNEQCPSRIGVPIENISSNSILYFLKDMRSVVNWLLTLHLITKDPFANFTIEQPRYSSHPVFISIEERNMLSKFDLSHRKSLKVQRDIFIFQCLIGCRYGDLVTLTEDNIIDGKFIQYVPHKTMKAVNPVIPRVPLNSQALELIRKYRGCDKEGRLFPFVNSCYYNRCLKEAFELAGLDRNVHILNKKTGKPEIVPLYTIASSHMARRTFIGNLYNRIKDPCIISAMSGHSENSRSFCRYRDIGDDARRELIEKII